MSQDELQVRVEALERRLGVMTAVNAESRLRALETALVALRDETAGTVERLEQRIRSLEEDASD